MASPPPTSQDFTCSSWKEGTPKRAAKALGVRKWPNEALAGLCMASSSAFSPAGSGRRSVTTSRIGVVGLAAPRSMAFARPGRTFCVTVSKFSPSSSCREDSMPEAGLLASKVGLPHAVESITSNDAGTAARIPSWDSRGMSARRGGQREARPFPPIAVAPLSWIAANPGPPDWLATRQADGRLGGLGWACRSHPTRPPSLIQDSGSGAWRGHMKRGREEGCVKAAPSSRYQRLRYSSPRSSPHPRPAPNRPMPGCRSSGARSSSASSGRSAT